MHLEDRAPGARPKNLCIICPYLSNASQQVKTQQLFNSPARAYQDILIIPGIEVSAIEGELIVLGVAESPTKPWTVENVIDFARERDGLVVVPHPYRAYGLGDLAKNYDVDAIEVLNGGDLPHLNKMAKNLAKETGLPGVAGSDAHRVHELWTVYTEVEASQDIDGILKAIKKGLVKVAYARKSIHF